MRAIIEFELPPGARVLRLEPGETGGTYLRVLRVLLTALRARGPAPAGP